MNSINKYAGFDVGIAIVNFWEWVLISLSMFEVVWIVAVGSTDNGCQHSLQLQ